VLNWYKSAMAADKPLLRKLAEEVLGREAASKIWKRIEVIGDIAIIRKPFDVDVDMLRPLAERLLEVLPYVNSVWVAITPVRGQKRLREYMHLAGEPRSETVYKEHGCLFALDIRRVYISPVLGYDHIRVARMVKPGEVVCNFFAGIGGYSIVISKHARPDYVISVDISSDAVRYLRLNVELNRVGHVNEVIHGDAFEVAEAMDRIDRALLPCPELSLSLFKELIAEKVVRCNGVIHAHEFVEADRKKQAVEVAYRRYLAVSKSVGIAITLESSHVVRSVGPRKWHVVLDLKVLC